LEKFGRELSSVSSVYVFGKWKSDGSVLVYSQNSMIVNYVEASDG